MYPIDEDKNKSVEEIKEQLIHEFAKQCNYILNSRLTRLLNSPATYAAKLCIEMKVDPGTYVAAQLSFTPIIKGQVSLIPEQLYGINSKIYVTNYIAYKDDRHIDREFEIECTMLHRCLEGGWSERLALLNSTFDFSPWFRILMCSDRDEEIITQYGRLAAQILNNDKDLVSYLKTIRSDTGASLDFSRIPNFKA